jgi:hypothetical protein
MAKDYFQDIVPPNSEKKEQLPRVVRLTPHEDNSEESIPAPIVRAPLVSTYHEPDEQEEDMQEVIDEQSKAPPRSFDTPSVTPRGIRNVSIPTRVRTPLPERPQSSRPVVKPRPASQSSRPILYGIIGLIVVLGGLFIFFATRPTVVHVSPRTQSLQFDTSSTIEAYPSLGAGTTSLTYTVASTDLSDFSDVASSSIATALADARASGSIMVYNNVSATPVKLLKNTRFETSDGLIFRTPGEVVVPATNGGQPGSVQITVIADGAGSQYNVGPTALFTVPGFKTDAKMYKGVYASSDHAMTGGVLANQAGVPVDVRTSAVSDIRARLNDKIRAYVDTLKTKDAYILPGLVTISYDHNPDTAAATGGVRITETAHVMVPVLSRDMLGVALGNAAGIDTQGSQFDIGTDQFDGQITPPMPSTIGQDPLYITLSGATLLVWRVDTQALARALAGTENTPAVFHGIITTFLSIDKAEATVAPLWSHIFPSDASKINIVVNTPPQNTASTSTPSTQSPSGI